MISTHAPVKGATAGRSRWISRPRDFNPRTREGCDVRGEDGIESHMISTHAPVKGATVDLDKLVTTCLISTHAPVKGATPTRGIHI